MRLSLAFAFLSVLALSRAAYFSEGWRPGQPIPTRGARPPPGSITSIPTREQRPISDLPDLPKKPIFEQLQDALLTPLTSGPFAEMLAKAGLNVTGAVERAKAGIEPKWHRSIPIIDDENFEELIEYETLTPEEEESRTWIIEITVPEGNAIALFADEQFDKAFNATMDAGNDLPNVRWARVNYMNVTMITTKWIIWRAPVIVVARHRGKELRFFKPANIRLRELRGFLQAEAWKSVQPWKSDWAPGGERAWILHQYGLILQKYYSLLGSMPKWAIMIMTGMIGSTIISFLHGTGSGKKKPVVVETVKAKAVVVETPVVVAPAAAPTPAPAASKKSKKKSAGK